MPLPRRIALALLLGVFVVLGAFLTPSVALAVQPPLFSLRLVAQPLEFDGGAAVLDGLWQFHLGDNLAWAAPSFDDSGWEQLKADKPWGQQGHPNRDGFGWYRLHVTLAPGRSPDELALLVPAVEDAYEVYWNGRLLGTYGELPPHPLWYFDTRPHTWGMGPAQSGVLAVRVWKAPFDSFDTGLQGGFYAPPVIGSPRAVAAAISRLDYRWLRSHQFVFAINSLYALVAFLGLGMWLRDRSQWLVFWMGWFAAAKPIALILFGLKLSIPLVIAEGLNQPFYVLADISLWFVLLHLLDLHSDHRVLRLTRILAIVDVVQAIVDGILVYGWTLPHPRPWQIADMALMPVVTVLELFPFYLIGIAVLRHTRLDPNRWLVAVLAFLSQTILVASIALNQGSRFTHFTLGDIISSPIIIVLGNPVHAQNITYALLLLALVYAVYRISAENRRQQIRLGEEVRNARAVQQILIPIAFPAVPGFTIESVYKPAEEVGGDFFQILPISDGGVLIVIGDVSGKGIPAAMTVSLLVGTVRTLAHYTQSPAEILAAMNQRMVVRSHGGFTTCLVLRAEPNGAVTLANAGHLAPYLESRELELENGLPLGLSASAEYIESTYQLAEQGQLTLMTDGVVEARNKAGELFGFDRTLAIAARSAESIAQAAERFGQEDDITVLTLIRQHAAQESTVSAAGALTSSPV